MSIVIDDLFAVVFAFLLHLRDIKLANITPVHKSGSKLSTNNYRGISLTSLLCKLFERILGSHILNYLSVNKNIIIIF